MIIKIMGLAFPIIGVWMKFRRGSLSLLRWAQHFFVVLWQERCGWFTWSFSKAAWVCPAREDNLCEWLAITNVVSRFDFDFIVCPKSVFFARITSI